MFFLFLIFFWICQFFFTNRLLWLHLRRKEKGTYKFCFHFSLNFHFSLSLAIFHWKRAIFLKRSTFLLQTAGGLVCTERKKERRIKIFRTFICIVVLINIVLILSGECDGRRGAFPSNYTKPINFVAPPLRIATSASATTTPTTTTSNSAPSLPSRTDAVREKQ